jgi:hypothetical protein
MHSIDIITRQADRLEGRSGEDGGWFKLTEVACNGSRLPLQPTMTPWPTQPLATLPSLWPQAAAASRPTQLPFPRPQARPSKSPPLPTRMTGGPTKRQPTRSPRIRVCRSAHSTCRSTKSCCGPERICCRTTLQGMCKCLKCLVIKEHCLEDSDFCSGKCKRVFTLVTHEKLCTQ